MSAASAELKGRVLALLTESGRVKEALREAGVPDQTFYAWRRRDPAFDRQCVIALREGRSVRRQVSEASLVFDPSRRLPSAPSLIPARLEYLGRPTPSHHQPVFGAWEDRTNLAVVVLGPPGPQPVWATVSTPAGERPIGDLRVGDEVFGPDGAPTRVVGVEDAGVLPCFGLRLSGGPTVFGAEGHRWPAVGKKGPKERTTRWLAEHVSDSEGGHRYWLPVPEPLQMPEADLPLDPYVLGVLLGDGSFRQSTVKFTSTDPGIVGEVSRRLPAGVAVHNYSNDIHWRLVGCRRDGHRPGGRRGIIRSVLKSLGLADHNAVDKFIPGQYMRGSVSQRLDLLRGLMDTDGYVPPRAGATFTTCSPRLRDQTVELVRSLGGIAWVGYEDRREGRNPTWTVRVQIRQNPFLLGRKASRYVCRERLRYRVERGFPAGDYPCVCIRVDAPHHQYLTEMVPSCNSGKDTTAGDIVLLESAFHQQKRHAWVMESSEFSIRRMEQRVAPYLVDYRAYERAPSGPGCVQPKRNLIDDFGPFRWRSGMVYPDSTTVPQPTWTKHAIYFLGRDNEADPNLWAAGIGGATYGARIDTGVTSDIFTPDNQGSPVVQADQLAWLFNTFFSRLDEGGRYLHLGTRVGTNDNQAEVLRRLVGEASILEQDGWYTKYANGVATVIYPAVQFDPDGSEVSYWPEMFPLDSQLILPDGESFQADALTHSEQKGLASRGARRIRGLREIRQRDPSAFETMYQQNPPSSEGGEFTRELLDHCDDYTRTVGVTSGKPLILGIDPARAGGAGWVLWEWDPEEQVSTVVDFFYGERLGIAGIREKLLVNPITTWWPRYAAYEYNHEASVLEHPDVMSAVDRTRTEVVRHFTAANRIVGDTRVAAMAFDLRSMKIRFPAATPADRSRMDQLKQHALNWDARSVKDGRPTRGGKPDHLWMAAWVGWVTVKQRLEKKPSRRDRRRIPEITRKRWFGHQPSQERQAPVESDLVSQFFQ